jgi:dihydrofolate reductase
MRIVLIAAQSVDGFIARHDEPGTAFASEADQAHFRAALAQCDSEIMGATTYLVARAAILGHATDTRIRIVVTRDPGKFAGDAAAGRLEFTSETPAALVARLRAQGRKRCALLGGSQIHSLFLDAGLADELWLTVEPRLFGGGVPLLGARADLKLRLLSHERLGDDGLLLKYAFEFLAK